MCIQAVGFSLLQPKVQFCTTMYSCSVMSVAFSSDGSVLCSSMWYGWGTRQVLNRDAILKQKKQRILLILLQVGQNYIMRSLKICTLLTQFCSGNKIEKNGMGGEGTAYGGEEGRTQGCDGET